DIDDTIKHTGVNSGPRVALSTKEFPDQILYIFIRDVSTERLKARPQPPKRTRSFPLFVSPRQTFLQLPSKVPKSMPTVIDTNSVEDNSVIDISAVDNSFVDHSGIDPFQEFQERVNKCRQKVPGGTFELFTDSQVLKVLKENDGTSNTKQAEPPKANNASQVTQAQY
ncbi:8189_t:CDS:2, partial [Gigaspora rosea]